MEDFSLADFIHLAVYHKRDLFAASPLGISPRSWHTRNIHPTLSTPHQRLPDNHMSSGGDWRSKRPRSSPRGAKMTDTDAADAERAKLDAEVERVRLMEIPQMQKWAQLLQNGGVNWFCL